MGIIANHNGINISFVTLLCGVENSDNVWQKTFFLSSNECRRSTDKAGRPAPCLLIPSNSMFDMSTIAPWFSKRWFIITTTKLSVSKYRMISWIEMILLLYPCLPENCCIWGCWRQGMEVRNKAVCPGSRWCCDSINLWEWLLVLAGTLEFKVFKIPTICHRSSHDLLHALVQRHVRLFSAVRIALILGSKL